MPSYINRPDLGRRFKILTVAIDQATLGDKTIIAAPANDNEQIHIVHEEIQANGAEVTVIPKDGTTALAKGLILYDGAPPYIYAGEAGVRERVLSVKTAYILNLSGNVQINGRIEYYVDVADVLV